MIVAGLILVAIGIFASLMLIENLQASQTADVAEIETVKTSVVIITRNLRLGDRIDQGDLELVSVPVELIPGNAVTVSEEAVGKIVKTDLVQGEMLLWHNLADPTHSNGDLSFILGEEHVLIAFPADDLMSREGVVQRGDLIDIFATFEQEIYLDEPSSDDAEEPIEPKLRHFTVDALQKINLTALVLDVIEGQAEPQLLGGQTTENGQSPQASIKAYLLALAPQEALILKHLKDINAIFDIVLRAPTATTPFELTPVTEEFIIEFYGLGVLP